MIGNKIYINSKTLIGELYSDYNIQSDDFVTRFPNWCYNCLEDLAIIQAYVEKETESFDFDNHLIPIPFGFKGVIDIIINNKRAELKQAGTFNKLSKELDEDFGIIKTPHIQKLDELFNRPPVLTTNKERGKYLKDYPDYYINGNYIHTNIEYGTVKLRYKCIPTIYDSTENTIYPMIYDVGILKKAIKLYVIKSILLRGYIHPVLNLKENNKYVNPALEYDSIRYRVKNACNKFNTDRRNNIVKILNEMQ